jgi:hypothetical protein
VKKGQIVIDLVDNSGFKIIKDNITNRWWWFENFDELHEMFLEGWKFENNKDHITVCICTYKRNELWGNLLKRLIRSRKFIWLFHPNSW